MKPILKALYISIAGNAVLAVAKLVAGLVGGSFAVVSDGIDSASDVAVSVVLLVTAKIMERKPNRKYVYGYAKAESIATKLLSMLIFFAGAEMFISAAGRLFSGEAGAMPEPVAVYVTVELMDGVKDESVYQKIFDALRKVEGVGNPHRVRSRSIGGKYMITLDVEADGGMTLAQAHALANKVEQSIRDSIPEVYDIVVHLEPFGSHPEEVFGIKGQRQDAATRRP